MRRWRVRAASRRALVLGLTVALLGACQRDSEPPERAIEPIAAPRIVLLISIDTLRADHLGLYGYERFTSPILDAYAKRGVVFEDASAAAPWTLPSHASMLTGLYPLRHRAVTFETRMPEGTPNLASLLGGAGWSTAAVVSTHLLKPEKYGLTRDFEDFLYVENAPDRRTPNSWVTDQAIEWIRDSGEEKLFLFVHYYDVHADYTSQPEFERLFVEEYDGPANGTGWQNVKANLEPEYLELCHENFDPKKCTFGNVERPRVIDETVQRMEFSEEDVRHIRNLYDAGIRQMDTELGRLFAFVDEQGLADQTLTIITSDHGEEFLDHGRLDHFLPMWQEILRIPLIVVGPGIPADTRIEAPVSNIDIMPTVLTWTGFTGADTPVDGLDLGPLIRGGPRAAFDQRVLHGEASGGHQYETILPGLFPVFQSVRRGQWKLVHDSKSGRHTLFDLSGDPGEQTDVLDQHPEIARELVAELESRRLEFAEGPAEEDRVKLDQEELERLRALGYVP